MNKQGQITNENTETMTFTASTISETERIKLMKKIQENRRQSLVLSFVPSKIRERFDELAKNIREAVELHLEGEDLAEFNLAPHPSVLMNLELPTQINA